LIFVLGHPGSTRRLITYAQLKFEKNYFYPYYLKILNHKLNLLNNYSKIGKEQKRRAGGLIFSFQNSIKVSKGEYQGLLNPKNIKKFENQEKNLKTKLNKNPKIKKEVEASFNNIEKACEKYKSKFNEIKFKKFQGYKLPNMAASIVLYVHEIKKPDGERLDGFHDSELESWKFRMLSPAPIYKDLEEILLIDALKQTLEKFGYKDKFVKILLGGKTPEIQAFKLIKKTRLDDPKYRKALIEGGEKTVLQSDDSLIKLALKLEPYIREMIKWEEDNIESVVTSSSEKIASARFKIYAKTTYPDATFTLRLAYGSVKGYPMNGTLAPYNTTFYGLYDRFYSFDRKDDWSLPESYIKNKEKINLEVPVNFVSTADIIGGNSGSPVINKNAELVGLIFDGNIESLAGDFIYSIAANRAVAVHPGAIIEVLQKIYQAQNLADEILKN
ncbi:MAG: S46 family peptidase, partial [Armatimonadetes bacterium]|nr:S46 family peptidase [Armatimonadota bacterium]